MQPIVPQHHEQLHATLSSAQHSHQHPHPHLFHSHSSHAPQEPLQQQQQPYNSSQPVVASHISLERNQHRDSPAHPHTQLPTTGKQRSSTHYGQRYNPMFAAISSAPPPTQHSSAGSVATFPQISVSQSAAVAQNMTYGSQAEAHSLFPQGLTTSPGLHGTGAPIGPAMISANRQSLIHQLPPAAEVHDQLAPTWSPASMPAYTSTYETKYAAGPGLAAQQATGPASHPSLIANNIYARSLHTPFYQMGLPLSQEATFDYGAQGSSTTTLLDTATTDSLEGSRLPAFDVKAYTFRKKSRHYVAVKHKNALRIEPIIYLKTSVLDNGRDIMQVLAKNFKLTPAGEPVIDIRKGHVIVCIKLNCYCDHHNEQEGFVVRMQTEPEIVRVGSSVKLRICCEARSKSGPAEPEAEEEDGLTDIDAPISTGSRSPAGHERSVQSPSLSFGSESPDPGSRQRLQSTNSSLIASPRSMDERVVNSLSVGYSQGVRAVHPPAFRQIYPLTPSEGTCLGGTRVTIHGAHFDTMQNPVVYFGEIPAELVTISHHDVMECTTPPAEGLKPGIVAVNIASLAFPLSPDVDTVDFMYMAPPDYDFYNLVAQSLSYAMANEYPHDNSLAYILNAHGPGLNAELNHGMVQGNTDTLSGDTLDLGLAWGAKEDIAIEFLRVIQALAPGRVLPAFKSESGHTLLHLASQSGMHSLAKELLDMGIDHTAVDRNPLHFAQMVSDINMVQLLSEARIPPRPMVPRLETGAAHSSMRKTVITLIRKHESTLRKALAQLQERNAKDLQGLRDRSLRVMELRDRRGVPSDLSIDADDDDITVFLGESSPSTKSSDGSESSLTLDSPTQDVDRKRKSRDEPTTFDTFKRMSTGSAPITKQSVDNAIDLAQLEFIQNGIKDWEDWRDAQLFGHTLELTSSTDIQVWVCESATITPQKDSADSDVTSAPTITSADSTLTALALSATGLHLLIERSLALDANARKLEHWSLAEIEELNCVAVNGKDVLQIDMCSLIPRGRELSGERIQADPVTASYEILNAIRGACTRLMEYQRLLAQDTWLDSRLKMWSALYNAEERELESVIKDQLEIRGETLTLKAAQDDHQGHSLAMMSSIICTARDLGTVSRVQFEGAVVAEDGWGKLALIRKLEKTVRVMRQVIRWEFSGCGWTSKTAEGFIKGLKPDSNPNTPKDQSLQQCREIRLAGNKFGGEDAIGHLLVECAGNIRDLETLDLTDCDLGLAGMETLVHHLSGLGELRLHGNRADKRWWQWMETVLTRNPDMERCSLGARITPADPQGILLTQERLKSLKELVELDLTGSPMTKPMLDVIEAHVRYDAKHFQTLVLAHCQLSWTDISSIFKTICEVNLSTKFTLNVSKNPLFDSEEAVQLWERDVYAASVNVPFGIQIIDLLLSDATLQRILSPLEDATCFNELNIKGLYIKPNNQVTGLASLPYDEARAEVVPERASKESCLILRRILTSNKTLVMLDVSGNNGIGPRRDDSKSKTAIFSSGSSFGSKPGSHSFAVGGFGRDIALVFPALAQNSTLRVLAIDYNLFGEDNMLKFCEAMRSNRSIGVLSCDGNDAFTPKGLRAVESIFPPVSLTTSEDVVVESEQEDLHGYNRTLSVWTLERDEILMHMQLLAMDVRRLTAEYNRIEKMQTSNVIGGDIKFLGTTPLADVQRRWDAAARNRIEYGETHARIVKAIGENNRRTKRAYQQKQG
ncbi:hypothetical protein BGZ54_005019 [Gamsiella multidivaricata]|nr:hypothetical protein BGZ54_005019 [Gamsiella multidivaricata]